MANLNLSNNYLILSRDISSDSNDNMLSIFKIIDSMNFNTSKEEALKFQAAYTKDPSSIMGVPVRYVVCTSWSIPELADSDHPLRVEYSIIDPMGSKISEILQEAVFPKSNDVLRINMVTEGFPYTVDGKYEVHVKVLGDNSSSTLCEASTRVRLTMSTQPTA